jgi:hypothetical protein
MRIKINGTEVDVHESWDQKKKCKEYPETGIDMENVIVISNKMYKRISCDCKSDFTHSFEIKLNK